MKLPKLYKIDTKGKIREWEVSVIGTDPAIIKVIHGAQNGAKQEKNTFIYEGKNIGKANETTPLLQAISEAKSKWLKQKDKGYSENPNPEKIFLPMLAHRFDKYPNKVKYPCYVQSKLDGVRANILYTNSLWQVQSRNGKPMPILNHLIPDLPTNIILDGELYSDKLTFQEIISACKRDEPNELTKSIKLHAYDLYDKNQPNLSFAERYRVLEQYITDCVVKVCTYNCENESDITKYHLSFIKDGYEGSIIRNKNGVYKVNGRSYDLLKVKDFEDDEFTIIDYTQDKNGEAVFVCDSENGTFDVKPKGTHKERVAYLNDKYIGCQLTVQYFGLTDDGIPRFPVGLRVREEE